MAPPASPAPAPPDLSTGQVAVLRRPAAPGASRRHRPRHRAAVSAGPGASHHSAARATVSAPVRKVSATSGRQAAHMAQAAPVERPHVEPPSAPHAAAAASTRSAISAGATVACGLVRQGLQLGVEAAPAPVAANDLAQCRDCGRRHTAPAADAPPHSGCPDATGRRRSAASAASVSERTNGPSPASHAPSGPRTMSPFNATSWNTTGTPSAVTATSSSMPSMPTATPALKPATCSRETTPARRDDPATRTAASWTSSQVVGS